MEQQRDRELARSPYDEATLAADYFFVRIADLMSLALCAGMVAPEPYRGYQLRLEGHRVRLQPDPFGGREIDCAVPARRVRNRPFLGTADVHAALAAAAPETLSMVASGT
jgi:hypothetical protein